MGKLTESDREFWRGVIVAGGFTAIPRWPADTAATIAEHEAPIADDLVEELRRAAEDLATPISSLLLAAHAKVLATLSGEREVVTGYVATATGRPVPCRLTTEHASWLALVREARHTESGLLAHRGFPVDDLRKELGLSEPPFETVLDPAGAGGD
ncbi:non-ribosomal peptide synthetase, partial [Pseudonocardia alaniniphila]